jgi:hypothetical protein
MVHQHGVSDVAMSAEEQKLFTEAVERARTLVSAGDTFIRDVAEPPVPGSPLAEAYAADLRDPFDTAQLLLFTTGDHLRALVTIADSRRLPAFALYALLRSAGEAAVRACHLLESGLSAEDRMARSLNERLMNLIEQKKLTADQAHFDNRLAVLQNRASQLGIKPLLTKQGEIHGFASPLPSMTDLFNKYLPGGADTYRILSAYAHSMQWLILRPSEAIASDTPGVSLVPLMANGQVLVGYTDEVTQAFDTAAQMWMRMAGQPADVWKMANQTKT